MLCIYKFYVTCTIKIGAGVHLLLSDTALSKVQSSFGSSLLLYRPKRLEPRGSVMRLRGVQERDPACQPQTRSATPGARRSFAHPSPIFNGHLGAPLGGSALRSHLTETPGAGNQQIHTRSEAVRAASRGPGKRLCLSHWEDAKGQRAGRARFSQQGMQKENTAGSRGWEMPAKLVPRTPEPPALTNSTKKLGSVLL